MRILIATQTRAVVGGVETYLRAALPMLTASGAEIGLLTASGERPSDGDILSACGDRPTWSADRPRVLSELAEWRPDVVYSHGLWDSAFECELARQFPTVYFAHNYGGTCVSGSKCHNFPGSRPCTRRLGPACLTLYLPRRCGGLNPLTALTSYRRERRRQRGLRDCRAVLVASGHMAHELARNGAPFDRIHLVPPAGTATPDPEPPEPRTPTGRVLFVGRMTPLKGCSHLLDAVPRAAAVLGRKLTLAVAGDGPERERLEADARRRNLSVEFLGWVGPARRQSEIRAADILAVPSVWPEPFGLVGIEAGCVGTPAVGYAVGGIPDWLEPGVSGESAPGERPDSREFATAIVRALADPGHLHKLRIGAWETARRFSPRAHLDRLLPILESAARP